MGWLSKFLDKVAENPLLPRLRLVQRFRARFGKIDPKLVDETSEELAKRIVDRAQKRDRRR